MHKYIFILLLSVFFLSCEDLTDTVLGDGATNSLEGIWMVNETSAIFKSTLTSYQVFIAADSSLDNRIWIENFYGIEEGEVHATVNDQSIQLSNQSFGGYTLTSGSGTVNNKRDEIEWSYNIDLGDGTIDEVTATYTKQ